MTALAPASKQPLPLALALGALGGGALVMTAWLTTNGPLIFVPYAALVLGSLVAVRLTGWPEFSRRFAAAFGAFMVATLVLYVSIGWFLGGASVFEISAWGHAWRLGMMALIGGVLSGAVAYLADLGRARGASEPAAVGRPRA